MMHGQANVKFDCKTYAYISYVVSEKYITLHNFTKYNENRNTFVLFFTRLEAGNVRNHGFIATRSFFFLHHSLCS